MRTYKPKRKLHHKKKGMNKKAVLITLAVILFIGIFGFYLPIRSIEAKGRELKTIAAKVKEDLKQNDLDLVQKDLDTMKIKYASFEKSAKGIYWARFIPFVGSYVSDFKNGVEAGDSLLEAGTISVDAIAPYADLLGFKKDGTGFANKSADERIQTAVLTLDKVLVKVDQIAVHVDDAQKHIDKINTGHYPEKLGNKVIRSRIENIRSEFDAVASLFVDSKPFLKKLPDILGAEKEKTYIVLFQNDKELRPTGGFLTAYAIFHINQGKLKVERSQDIYSLDDSIPSHPKAPKEILSYHKGVSTFFIRDSNLSPDFAKSVDIFETLYNTSRDKVPYDGIIAVDTAVLVDSLRILGDTEVRGTRFSANTDPRCDCPQVIYRLLDEIDKPVGFIKEDRKGILGDLLFAVMQKALSSSPSHYWGPLSQDMIMNLKQKHILLNFQDPEIQKSVETLRFAGRINDFDGDYLHINDTNFAGAKSNLFVKHSVTSNTIFNNDGSVKRELTLVYTNPYASSNCNLEAGQLCANAPLRNWLRVYAPKGSKLISFKGSQKQTQVYDDLNKTVFEGFFQVNPKGKFTVTITYSLPMNVENQKDYKLLIEKQPGTTGYSYILEKNGGIAEKFELNEDHIWSTK